ncbi:hypothetical protein [Microbacterium sp.]|uniref:hypothetical protein n=1 Tax=Microbacterium sp. TaxID=51671 RepID=UPI0039E32A77
MTPEPPTPYIPPRRRRTSLWVSLVLAAALVFGFGGYAALDYLWGRPTWEVQGLGVIVKGWAPEVESVEDTEALCATLFCEEGWRTNVGNYLLFGTEAEAEYAQMIVGGDSVRNGRLILDRNGVDNDEKLRRLSVEILAPSQDWWG